MPDYSAFVEQTSTDSLKRISDLADSVIRLYTQITELETKLKELNRQKSEIQERLLPDLFDATGQKELRTLSGVKLVYSIKPHHNVTKANKAAAMKWLDEHGFGGMIKRTVVAAFNKGEEEAAAKALGMLGEAGFDTRQDQEVAAATLGALIRRELEEGHTIPEDIFGIYKQRIVEVE